MHAKRSVPFRSHRIHFVAGRINLDQFAKYALSQAKQNCPAHCEVFEKLNNIVTMITENFGNNKLKTCQKKEVGHREIQKDLSEVQKEQETQNDQQNEFGEVTIPRDDQQDEFGKDTIPREIEDENGNYVISERQEVMVGTSSYIKRNREEKMAAVYRTLVSENSYAFEEEEEVESEINDSKQQRSFEQQTPSFFHYQRQTSPNISQPVVGGNREPPAITYPFKSYPMQEATPYPARHEHSQDLDISPMGSYLPQQYSARPQFTTERPQAQKMPSVIRMQYVVHQYRPLSKTLPSLSPRKRQQLRRKEEEIPDWTEINPSLATSSPIHIPAEGINMKCFPQCPKFADEAPCISECNGQVYPRSQNKTRPRLSPQATKLVIESPERDFDGCFKKICCKCDSSTIKRQLPSKDL